MAGAANRHDLPERVRAAYKGKNWLSLTQLANAFGISRRTMDKHVENGTLPWHRFGAGEERIRRAFTLADAELFWRRLNQPPPNNIKGRKGFSGAVSKR